MGKLDGTVVGERGFVDVAVGLIWGDAESSSWFPRLGLPVSDGSVVLGVFDPEDSLSYVSMRAFRGGRSMAYLLGLFFLNPTASPTAKAIRIAKTIASIMSTRFQPPLLAMRLESFRIANLSPSDHTLYEYPLG